ncbi:TetR/AcrR family transcriptional regulator [Frondihabitans australicus]|uniref:TetR family transcriptional regulator n=1 Tax=Frondihabitans australicus TaxID=386892 RepID=A0A495IBF8_9MICO|nr:TetR/AcrR family transcriptional regulator [Frondihabitans australicus]RKR73333.1 TetR family transcriptional regulator [Frondihabitans australicus]
MDSPAGTDSPRTRDSARTRSEILAAARDEFAREGFAGTTVRSVAAAAGVSPNLITRYFGGKEGLFVAATDVSLTLDRLYDGPRESLGLRLARSIVARWTGQPGDDPLLLLLRASGERPEAAQELAAFLDRESLEPLRRQLAHYGMPAEEAESRAKAIDILMLGVSARLRVLRDDLGEPAALEAWLAETIQRLVDAP